MNIDPGKFENLILRGNKKDFIRGFAYFSQISDENLSNIYYVLTRSTGLKDVDINFLLWFLEKANYVKIGDGKLSRQFKMTPSIIGEEFICFYYAVLLNQPAINDAVFVKSSFTIEEDEILVNVFSVPIKYRVFFTVLRNIGVLENTRENGVVKIRNYAVAKKFLERPLRKISPVEFEKEMERKKMDGFAAENFVFHFESARLHEEKIVVWVSQYVVNEGYDIASYNTASDVECNRFIEVKSYTGKSPYFYWSRNEVSVAETKGESYWLYLVNRDKMDQDSYEPLMINDPVRTILENPSFEKRVESYKISLR